MRGKSAHALLGRDALPPVPAEAERDGEPADRRPEPFPSAGAVLGEAMTTIAVFLLIALALHLLAVRMDAWQPGKAGGGIYGVYILRPSRPASHLYAAPAHPCRIGSPVRGSDPVFPGPDHPTAGKPAD